MKKQKKSIKKIFLPVTFSTEEIFRQIKQLAADPAKDKRTGVTKRIIAAWKR